MNNFSYNMDCDYLNNTDYYGDNNAWNFYNYGNYNNKYGLDLQYLSYNDIVEIERILDDSIKIQDEYLELRKYKLTKLPKKLKDFIWVQKMDIRNCYLDNLENLPINIQELDASNNKIKEINGLNLPGTLTVLKLEKNNITSINNLPPNLIGIDLEDNELSELNIDLPESLSFISIAKNKFRYLPKFSNNVTVLDISVNYITDINDLPDSITTLDCSRNELKQIRILPKNLKECCASNNKISYLWNLSDTIEYLDLSNNKINWVCNIPKNIKKIDLSNNNIRSFNFHNLPDNLEELNLENNENIIIPEYIKNNKKIKYGTDESDLIWNYKEDNYHYNLNRYNDNNFYNLNRYHFNNYSNNTIVNSKYNKTNPHYIIMKKKIEI